ncbi:hypothetical protein MAPG_12099, partial [Magnaporthiopsis poae ATCC 64411]
ASLPARSPANSVRSATSSSRQQLLAEAQTEFAENAPELLAARNQSLFALAQMGSPTPPDSDSDSDESDYESGELPPETYGVLAYTASSVQEAATHKTLWTPATQVNVVSTSLLWSPPQLASESPVSAFAPNSLDNGKVRAVPRKADNPLAIETNKLWQLSRTATKRYSAGLWQPRHAPAAAQPSPSSQRQQLQAQSKKQVPARASALKPPRRTRRMTELPDILESPQPLSDDRDALGLFQFPWGEKSDSANIQQPRHTMFAMPGTMTSGATVSAALDARSRQFEASEYSSSFFDDYDDDDLEESEDDIIEEEDSGDDFDETTLWEIASLLKTDNVPSSKNRAVPRTLDATSSVVDDYMDDASDLEEADEARGSIIVGLEGIMPESQQMGEMAEGQQQADILAQQLAISQLWTAARDEKRRSQHGLGLPHPDADTWRQYDAVSETLRSQPRQSEIVPIESDELWHPVGQKKQQRKMKNKEVAVLLWSARNRVTKTRGDHGKGVAQPDAATWSLYDTVKETIRALPRRSEPASIETDQLWQPAGQQQAAKVAKKAQASTPLMWSARPAPKARGDHGKGVAQPDEETWSRYDTVKETARALPRQSELVPIESDELWQPLGQPTIKKQQIESAKEQPTESTKVAMMWSARPATKAKGDHAKGVAYPDAATWSLYDTVKATARALPRQSELASVESDQLWQSRPVNAHQERNWLEGTKQAKTATQPVSLSAATAAVPKANVEHGKTVAKMAAQPVSMWTVATAVSKVRGEHGKGVAQPDAATWSLYDTVRDTARSQPRQSELVQIESDQLWQPRAVNARQQNWMVSAKQPKVATQSKAAAQPLSMWTVAAAAPKIRGEHGKGVAQPDAATWSLYDTVRETARSQPRQSDEPLVIESSQFWQPSSQTKKQTPVWILAGNQNQVKPAAALVAVREEKVLLWSASAAIPRSKGNHGKGVAHPDATTWALYDNIRETARSKPRQSEEPLPIKSDRLWQPAGHSQSATVLLWTAPVKTAKAKSNGLPQPDEATWRRYDATKETARAKARPAEPATIESTHMWILTPPQSPKEVVDWIMAGTMAKTPASPISPTSLPSPVSVSTVDAKEQAKTSLWIAAAPVIAPVASTGLFQLPAKTSDSRSTSESPAALGMVRKARSPELKPLDKLTSTDLWVAAAPANVKRNWILMKQASPATKTSSPKAASIPILKASPADWDLAVKQAADASYPAEWTSRWSASSGEWTAALEQAIAASRFPPMAEQSQAAAPRPSATAADWALALSEAVKASYPAQSMTSWAASAAEWDAALEQAVTASAYP